MKKQKILLVSQYCEFAGAPMLALNIGKEMRKQGHQVFCICIGYGALYKEMIKQFPTIVLPKGMPLKVATRILSFLGYKRVLVNTTMGGYIVPYAKKSGMKVVSLIHELPKVIIANKAKEVAKNIVKHSDKVVFACNYVKERYVRNQLLTKEQVCIQPQGLYKNFDKPISEKEIQKLKKQLHIPEQNKVVIGVGMDFRRKGTDLFVNMAKRLKKQAGNISFLWIGANEGEDRRIMRAGKKEGVIFIGNTDAMGMFYQMADVFCMTSREDPFPSVVLEAIYFDVPVLAFENAGGFCELPKEYVKLVPYEDVEALAEETLALLEESPKMERDNQTGKEYICENYNFSNYVRYLVNLFN